MAADAVPGDGQVASVTEFGLTRELTEWDTRVGSITPWRGCVVLVVKAPLPFPEPRLPLCHLNLTEMTGCLLLISSKNEAIQNSDTLIPAFCTSGILTRTALLVF